MIEGLSLRFAFVPLQKRGKPETLNVLPSIIGRDLDS
jgi:hypothetical protein